MVLVDNQWQLRFPDAFVLRMPIVNSEHTLILLNLEKFVRKKKPPFILEAMWFTHELFKEALDSTWNPNSSAPITKNCKTSKWY